MTAVNGHRCDYDCDYITRSTILVLRQTKKFAGEENIRIRVRKLFTQQNAPIPKGSGLFEIPTSNSGFKISGDMTKPGSFYFGFVLLSVNGKTNPVLKTFRIRHESGNIFSSVNLV